MIIFILEMKPDVDNLGVIRSEHLYLLPQTTSLNTRGDFVFLAILFTIFLSLIIILVLRIKIFGKTLSEYIKPIWYFILICIGVVFWQYLFGVNLEGNSLQLRISQWLWQGMVLVSAYKLSRVPGFGYGNMFFLGILYSFIIHGLKVSIRYFFFGKTLLYVLDRFLYGSLLVMVFAFVLGSTFVYLKNKKST